jgi:imidazoleglycerol-phosphate dehydratase
MNRSATVERNTRETQIEMTVDLQDDAERKIDTAVPFFDHLLHAMSYHGGFGLAVSARGDIAVDPHHLVEDVGIVMGTALTQLADGIARYGHAVIPMDESLSEVVVDVCGRPTLVYSAAYPQAASGSFDLSLIREFLSALSANARVALHASVRYGENGHHMAESLFKALGKALAQAYAPRYADGTGGPRSTKGVI